MSERAVAVLILLSLLGCGRSDALADKPAEAAAAPAAVTPPEFQLPSAANDTVIRIAWRSPLLRRSPTTVYTLFGDGRLERQSLPASAPPPATPSAVPAPTGIVTLDAQEMHELAALAASPDLIEGDAGVLAKELYSAGVGIMDGAMFTVDVRLTSYARGTVSFGPVERRYALVEPATAAEANPQKKGVQALARLVRAVVETHKAKEAKQ